MAGVKKEAPKEAKKAPKSEAKKEETPKAAKESKKSDKKATFAVQSCSCTHEFQDTRYGPGQRAHNPTSKGTRCTVCGANKG
jgi:hypothetical protein